MPLATLAKKQGLDLVAIGGRNQKRCQEAVSFVDQAAGKTVSCQTLATDAASACAKAQLVFLTVPDAVIQPLCEELVEKNSFLPGTVVVHVSGALPSNILGSAKDKCLCTIASAHPLQTFAITQSSLTDLTGTYWFLQGDDQALEVLSQVVETLKGRPSKITAKQKVLYHAASVLVSNYLTALIDAAIKVMEEAGIERKIGSQALEPLIRSAVNNTLAVGPESALTGPISRGDALTVRAHLQSLGMADRNLTEIYKALGQQTIMLAVRKGSIDQQQAQMLSDVLTADSNSL